VTEQRDLIAKERMGKGIRFDDGVVQNAAFDWRV
jgi:hypothetical protein